MTHDEQQTIHQVANAGADAVARWRQSKRATRNLRYRQRMEQVKEPMPPAWLQAVERDDQAEAAERELEERTA
jgi:hypothetical protein